MSKKVALVITEDPEASPRPVEALRIALGLCAGDHDITVVLLGKSPLLLTDDTDDVKDVDILERYRPSFAQLQTPFLISVDSPICSLPEAYSIRRIDSLSIRRFLQSIDRSLVF